MSPLLSAGQLAGLSQVTIVDVRYRLLGPPGRGDYEAGHIPGAVFLDLDADLCGTPGPGGRHPLPDPADLQESLRRAGIHPDVPVVVYDGGDGLGAGRAWWTLRWAGLTEVYVLEGGFPSWEAAGGPVSADVPVVEPSELVVKPGGMPVVDAEGALELARQGKLFDVRAPERFRGETEPIDPVAGHIPGARNAPGDLPADLPRDEPFGLYCGSGVTAARAALAAVVAGFEQPVVYVGSWSGWITDPQRPVAVGD
ncbi:sulfurtransferase [Longispora albida]|uniref:sulfurtransferase n=1 Tax=Longispora albida TaxID=203523 RepID=UPI00037BAFDA|nr:sulfurtransferase [Longispora albida]